LGAGLLLLLTFVFTPVDFMFFVVFIISSVRQKILRSVQIIDSP